MIDELGIVIVTYNPDESNFIFNLNKYIDSSNSIVIVDNSEKSYISKKLSDYSNVEYLSTNENIGIAKAQNMGIEYLSSRKNINYLLFFDQDSYLTSKQINELVRSFNKLNNNYKVALIAPGSVKREGYTFEREVISSGSLISLKAIKNIGEMRDDFFIDFVDYEWCWRARSRGYKVMANNSVILSHQTDNPKKVIGKIVSSPIRNYYFFRNSIYSVKHHLLVDSYLKFLLKLFKHLIFEVIFCKDRKKRIGYISHGIKDGFLENMGKI